MSNLARAIEIASTAHKEQTRLDGSPYILHPLRLMFQIEGELQQMAAVHHDVVEDTEWTFEDLRKEGFDEALIEALDCLTRRDGESYKHSDTLIYHPDRLSRGAFVRFCCSRIQKASATLI